MISIQFTIMSSKQSLSLNYPAKILYAFIICPVKTHNQPLLFLLIRSPNNIECSVQIMNLVTFYSSSVL